MFHPKGIMHPFLNSPEISVKILNTSSMRSAAYPIRARVWLYPGDSPWHFITIQKADADEIKKEYVWPRRGFGAIPVNVTILRQGSGQVGKTSWKTSIFPDKDGTYLLPLKKELRKKEDIKVGDIISVSIEVIT